MKPLRICSLNTWGGVLSRELLSQIDELSTSVDVFTFQEVTHSSRPQPGWYGGQCHHDLYSELLSHLSDFIGYFQPLLGSDFGLATFIRKGMDARYEGSYQIFDGLGELSGDPDDVMHPSILLSHIVEGIRIVNVHGAWIRKTKKRDTKERLLQSERIREFLSGKEENTIIIGDLNLRHDGKSLKILEKKFENLIRTYEITDTRTIHYDDPYRYADYALVGRSIGVHQFDVDPSVASDHALLRLAITLS